MWYGCNTQSIRQKTTDKLAIAGLFVKLVLFFLTSTTDDGAAVADYFRSNEKKKIYEHQFDDYRNEWTPKLGAKLGLTRKEYRVKRRQYEWHLRKEGDEATLYLQHEGGGASIDNTPNYNGDQNHDVNFPTAIGYYNLSCPFEWYKYSCASMQENDFDAKVTEASTQYYRQHFAFIRKAFDSLFDVQISPQHPKRIFMTGDSLLRQLFISLACNAFSLYDDAVELAEVQWRNEWPCPPGLSHCRIRGGLQSGFDAASIRFTSGVEIHFVPHHGFAYGDMSKGEPEVLGRLKEQIDRMGTIDFGIKTAFPPSGPMDALVYNVGVHYSISQSKKIISYFDKNIATPLIKKGLKGERRPKLIYVLTPTQHFNTDDGQYIRQRMDDEKSKCVERVPFNPRAELEKRQLKTGYNVDMLLDYDDLELGGLHVQKGDCTHYCMPGAVDLVAARLLETLSLS